jgi:tetratricopeptide (TPR) repeat protein
MLLGNIYSRKKQPHQSINFLLKALELKTKSSSEITSTLYLLAKESFSIGEREKAKEWLSEGLYEANTSNDRKYQLKLEILQFQLRKKVETDNYRDALKEALFYFENRGSDFASDCAELLAHYYESKNHYKNAYHYLQLANALKKKNKY